MTNQTAFTTNEKASSSNVFPNTMVNRFSVWEKEPDGTHAALFSIYIPGEGFCGCFWLREDQVDQGWI